MKKLKNSISVNSFNSGLIFAKHNKEFILNIYKMLVIKKNIIVFILFSFSSIVAYSQREREEVPPLRERLFIGGSVGLQFGTITDIQLSPVVGLWILPRLSVAVGPNFRYYKYYDDETTIYGAKAYTQFVIVQNLNNVVPLGINTGIFLHLENELLSLESQYWQVPPYSSERFFINSVLIGPGLNQQLGRRSAMNIAVLWVLTDSGYSLYSNPEFRIMFSF